MWLSPLAAAAIIGYTVPAFAQVAEPGPREERAIDLMNLLSDRGLHDLKQERWNLYGQVTHISSYKLPFSARYTNLNGSPNSLLPGGEHSFTTSATLYAGLALWRGAEVYWAPEVIALRALSELKGLGGAVQNFELQKSGSMWPTLYQSRIYFRQTVDFAGSTGAKTSDPLQLGTKVSSRRLVVTVGKFSVLDFLDKNTFSGDLRRQFFNMSFLTYSAYDFAADARGYAWGGVVEYYHDDWVLRFARMTPPKHPNQLDIDFRIYKYYGDQLEFEHSHEVLGQPGAVRILGYRNREEMGRFTDALAAYRADPSQNASSCTSFNYGSENASAPDLCWARRPNVKMGMGINLEQRITNSLGLFLRGMVSDGRTEVYSYMSADRSLSFGALAKGTTWRRPNDLLGAGFAAGWISKAHAEYLGAGGIDGFIGDGQIRAASERVLELFYSLNVVGPTWLSLDYQRISNPAFNADRGPVNILGARAHAEF